MKLHARPDSVGPGMWVDVDNPRRVLAPSPVNVDRVVSRYPIIDTKIDEYGNTIVGYVYPSDLRTTSHPENRRTCLIPHRRSDTYRVDGDNVELFIPRDRISPNEALSELLSDSVRAIMVDPLSGVVEPWFEQTNVLGDKALFTNPDSLYGVVPIAKRA